MTAPIHPRPFALSLSKGMRLRCFDRLSTNGAGAATVDSEFPNGR